MRKELLLTLAVVFAGALALGSYARAASDAGSSGGSSSFGDQSSGRNAPSSRDTGRGTGTSSSGSASVKQIQQALKDKGQDPGPIDGVMGGQTKSALKAYQSANNLKATGMVDAETAKSLGVKAPSSSSFSDRSSGRNAPSARDAKRGSGPSGTTANTGTDTSGSFSDQSSGRNAPSSRDKSSK
ncbi:MAG TPA: peptidoglycan-binding domain-containing protein [Candidatus Binatia bacterium]|jgi:peptidoglycan hydrolase-like protein with peptidoglycan-binding domain